MSAAVTDETRDVSREGSRRQELLDAFRGEAALKRLLACIAGGLVLGLMVGQQEGSTDDYGQSFHKALLTDNRWLLFVGIGVALFLVLSLRFVITPYVSRPGMVGVAGGFLLVLIALQLLKWFDPVGKFGPLSDQVADTPALGFPASLFFGWFGYALWFACLVLGVVAVALRTAVLGWALAVLGAFAAFCAFYGHDQVVDLASPRLGPDHALGVWVATLGFLVTAGAGLVVVFARSDESHPRAFVDAVMAWRPGFPLAVLGALLALISLLNNTWFAPTGLNTDFRGLSDVFDGTGVQQLALAYADWLGVVLVVVTAAVALAGGVLRIRILGLVAIVLAAVSLVLTLVAMHGFSQTGTEKASQYGKLWQNLGAGGWVMCIALSLLLTAGTLVLRDGRRREPATTGGFPLSNAARAVSSSTSGRALLPIAVAIALFYPPTLTGEWQNTLVTQIGPYLLLAVGLNVVIGWSGLLDLGYIAFYAVGAYTTAYLTGSLPVKPPSFLSPFSSPLWAIPFAVAAALLAGVLLGAPTLRLRGDYLAIVTLGFGEIIQVVANNNPGGVTGGARGPNVPSPVLHIGPINITWGEDNLPFWYLLLAMLGIVVVVFVRLERSRLGRAWAAIREDEVAAEASGVKTIKVKLLAFAIGASTSGLAGVFFATQVGYFDPSLFTLQNSILIVAYVVFGGMGSLPGALAGAAVLTWLPVFLRSQVPQEDQQMWIGALVLLMMIFRPAGLIPARRRKAELAGLHEDTSTSVRAVPAAEGN